MIERHGTKIGKSLINRNLIIPARKNLVSGRPREDKSHNFLACVTSQPPPITPCKEGKAGLHDTIKASERLTKERHARRQKRLAKRLYCATPEGVEVTA